MRRLFYVFDLQGAILQYRDDNDWLTHFFEERCIRETTLTEKSGELYAAYRQYCAVNGEYTRSTSDFYTALAAAGFERKKTEKGIIVKGLQLNPFETDFLSEAAS